MSRYSSAPDMSMKGHTASPGMAITLAFMCGHKGARAGAAMRGHIQWRCAKCVSAKSGSPDFHVESFLAMYSLRTE